MYLQPEPGWDTNLGMSTSNSNSSSPGISPDQGIDDFLRSQDDMSKCGESVGDGTTTTTTGDRGWTKTPKIRTPKAYHQVKQALLRVEADLPVERRTNWEVWDGKMGGWHFTPGRKKEAVTLVSLSYPKSRRTSIESFNRDYLRGDGGLMKF